ncbi:MAG: hypothetical protein K8H86_06000 [Ignavibacteriaceae bacterium]|nr:hypothetical protein [Ignavibacteriaceae bacterium]
MIWRFQNTGVNTGRFNMDYDLQLAEECRTGEAALRLYRWVPYCISLGANQPVENINIKKAEDDGLDIVKRPTGGRAVLHSEELTYSVIYPIGGDTSAHNVYHQINMALAKGLTIYDDMLASVDLENIQPDFLTHYKNNNASALCFAMPAKSELKLSGRKLVGSAQRKLNNVILQHGSILTGKFHRRLVNYLNLPGDEIEKIEAEIKQKTIELESILNKEVDFESLSSSIKEGFENYFDISFVETSLLQTV